MSGRYHPGIGYVPNYTVGEQLPRDTLGLPDWLFHPIEALKCSFHFVVNEVEDYSILPLSLIGGGLAIYYLRKSPRE